MLFILDAGTKLAKTFEECDCHFKTLTTDV
jgi:hypothetical protein